MDSLERKAEREVGSYEKISPTAWGVAYRRTLSDIPFSLEIFDELQKIVQQTRSAAELRDLEQSNYPEITPVFEARFKLVNRLLKKNNAQQILEIAAGFSPRSIEIAKDPTVEYVEVDLPGVMNEKRSIIEKLAKQSKIPRASNLHLTVGNALDMQDLLTATKPFRKEPIAVVNEGFLRYLNVEERTAVAKNVYQLLERFGGVWITPDLCIPTGGVLLQSDEKMKEHNARIERMTGIDIAKNRFENEQAARGFFENLGFEIERHSFMEVSDELVSPQKLNLSKEQVEKIIRRHVVFVMRLEKVALD